MFYEPFPIHIFFAFGVPEFATCSHHPSLGEFGHAFNKIKE
jgi:hypothetical protein